MYLFDKACRHATSIVTSISIPPVTIKMQQIISVGPFPLIVSAASIKEMFEYSFNPAYIFVNQPYMHSTELYTDL